KLQRSFRSWARRCRTRSGLAWSRAWLGLVNGGEIALPIGVGGELCEALRHAHAKMAAKCAVARHATLAITQHVDRRDIDKDVLLLVQPAQPLGVVVQDQLAGMTGGERIEHVLVWNLGVKLA